MSSFTIRPARANDAQGVATVHVKTWQCAYRGQIPDDYLDGLSIRKRTEKWNEMLTEQERGMKTLVAEINDKIVGWCSFGKNRDADASTVTAELGGIYVDPDYIGQGIGSALLKSCIDTVTKNGYKKVTLWVLDTNTKAREFYEKKGWVIEGHTKNEKREGIILQEVRYILNLGKSVKNETKN